MFKIKRQTDSAPLPTQDFPEVIFRLLSAKEIRTTKYPRTHPSGYVREREINYYHRKSPEQATTSTGSRPEAALPRGGESIPQNTGTAQNGSERRPEDRSPWAELLPQLTDDFLEEKGLRRIAGAPRSRSEGGCPDGNEKTRSSPDAAQKASEGLATSPWVMMLPFLADEFLADLGLEPIPGVPRGGWVGKKKPGCAPPTQITEFAPNPGVTAAPKRRGRKPKKAIQSEATESLVGSFLDAADDIPCFSPENMLGYIPPGKDTEPEAGEVPTPPKRRGRKPGRNVAEVSDSSDSGVRQGRSPGRKAQSATVEKNIGLASEVSINSSDAAIETRPKHRGRKPGSKNSPREDTLPGTGNSSSEASLPPAEDKSSELNVSADIPEQPKRRGRKPGSKNKPRNNTGDSSGSLPALLPEDVDSIPPVSEPKRRGRKPKADNITADTAEASGPDVLWLNTPTTVEKPAILSANGDSESKAVVSAPKKRGRKPVCEVGGGTQNSHDISITKRRKTSRPQSTSEEAAYKQSVLRAMGEYREREGLGCWGRLAGKTKIPEDTIRYMFDSGKVAYSVWVKIGTALGLDKPLRS